MNIYIVGAKWSPRGESTESRVDSPQKLGRIDLGRIGIGANRPATFSRFCVSSRTVLTVLGRLAKDDRGCVRVKEALALTHKKVVNE